MARTDNLNNFLTDVANSIRNKKGTSEPILASQFDVEIENIKIISEYNTKINSNITSNSSDITDLIVELPPLEIGSNVTNISQLFYGFINLILLPDMNTGNITNMSSMCNLCSNLLRVNGLDTSKVNDMSNAFANCDNLETIGELDCSNVTNIRRVIQNSYNVTNLGGFKNLGQSYSSSMSAGYTYYNLDLSYSTKITHESLMNVINNLYDILSIGCPTQNLTLGATNIAKLTEEEIKIATDKGWNVI